MGPKVRLSEKERGMRANKGAVSIDGAKTFVSFSEVASTPSHSLSRETNITQEDTSLATNLSPIYLGDDIDLSVITKKLTKKNPVSRLKALQELKVVLQDRGRAVVPDLAPFFVFIYNRLVLENQANIREESNVILELLMQIDKKSFAGHMKHLIAPWYFSTCDPGREIGSRAQAALETAFPPKKRREVLTFFSGNILRYLMENVNNATPESLCDASVCSDAEAEDRYERVLTGTYAALARFLCWLFPLPPAAESGEDSSKGGRNRPFPLPADTSDLLKDHISISFFKKTTSKRLYVRHGALEVLTAVCAQCPHLLVPPSGVDGVAGVLTSTSASSRDKDNLAAKKKQPPLGRLSMIVCNAFTNEKEASNIPNTLSSFLSFVKAYPAAWAYLELPVIVKRLLDLLTRTEKEAATVETSLSYTLPILAAVPHPILQQHHDCVLVLFEALSSLTLLPRFLKGPLKPKIALIEMCTYFIVQFSQAAASEGEGESESEGGGEERFTDVFMPKLIGLSIDLCVEEWKRKTRISGDSPIAPLLRALHRAHGQELVRAQQTHPQGMASPSFVHQFWEVFSSGLSGEIGTMMKQISPRFTVETAEKTAESEDDIDFEAIVWFIDNVLSCVLSGSDSNLSCDTVPRPEVAVTEFGIYSFLKYLFEEAESHLDDDRGETRLFFAWMHVVLQIAPALLDSSTSFSAPVSPERLLRFLVSKYWVCAGLNCVEAEDGGGQGVALKFFVLGLLRKSFGIVATLSESDPAFEYRCSVLQICQEKNSLVGICVSIDSGMISEDMTSVAFRDPNHELSPLGIYLQDCFSLLCSQPLDETVVASSAAILSSEINSQIKFLVLCLEKNFMSSLINAESVLFEQVETSVKAMYNSSRFEHNVTAGHWAFLNFCQSHLGKAEGESSLGPKQLELITLLQTVVFLNRKALRMQAKEQQGEGVEKKQLWGGLITSWKGIQNALFPVCPPCVVDDFASLVVSMLNAKLYCGLEGRDSGSSHVSLGSALSSSQGQTLHAPSLSVAAPCDGWDMTLEMWSEHAHGLLLIARQHPICLKVEDVIARFSFHSVDLWRTLSKCLLAVDEERFGDANQIHVKTLEGLCFVIRSIFNVDTLWVGGGGISLIGELVPVTTDVSLALTVVQTLVLGQYAQRQRVSCAAVPHATEDLHDFLECCQLLISSCVEDTRETGLTFANDLLTHARGLLRSDMKCGAMMSADGSSGDAGSADYLRAYSLLEAISLIFKVSVPTRHVTLVDDETRRGTPLARDSPLFSDNTLRGTPVCYVSIEDRVTAAKNEGESNGVNHKTFIATRAALMSTHRDDGPENPAFYTLTLSDEGDREIQTEEKRVILIDSDGGGRSPTHGSSDTVGLTTADEITAKDPTLGPLLGEQLAWLDDCVLNALSASSTLSLSGAVIDLNVCLLGKALHHVLSFVDTCPLVKEVFLGHCRQVCLTLLESKFVERPCAVLCGLEVLCALVSPTCAEGIDVVSGGVGQGLWVSSVLLDRLDSLLVSLKSTSRLVLSVSVRFTLLIQICRVFPVMLRAVFSRKLRNLVEEFTTLALSAVNNYDLEEGTARGLEHERYRLLCDIVVGCLAALWECADHGVKAQDEKGSAVGVACSADEGGQLWSSVYHSDLDLIGLRHCFDVLWSQLRSSEGGDRAGTEVELSVVVRAIDLCLQNQLRRGGRQAGVVLLQACDISMRPSTARSSARSSARDDIFMLSVIGDPHIDPSIRVILTKVLDIAFTSQSFLAGSVRAPLVNSGTEGEEEELVTGEGLTRHLLGDCLFEMFKNRSEMLCSGDEAASAGYIECSSEKCPRGHDSDVSLSPHISDSVGSSFSLRSLVMSGILKSIPGSEDDGNAGGVCRPLSKPATKVPPTQEKCMDSLGLVLLHMLVLQKIDTMCSSSEEWAHHRATIGLYLTQSGLITPVLRLLIEAQNSLPETSVAEDFAGIFSRMDPCLLQNFGASDEVFDNTLSNLFAYSLYRSTSLLPVATRTYWNDHCNRSQRGQLERFIETRINRSIVKREIGIVRLAEKQGRVKMTSAGSPSPDLEEEDGSITVRCSAVAREFITTFTADEVSVEMTIRLPSLYPLRNVEVDCTKKMGISEGRWRRWTLQIIQLLSHQDGSVLDAILLWKKNVDKEFEGVEPCPICYSILHPKTLSLPTLCCSTCKNKFHSPCLYKWFSSSGKSKCVLCQQPFF